MPKNAGRKSRWNDATRAQVAGMRSRGMSQAAIAEAFDTTQQAISRLCRQLDSAEVKSFHDASDPALFVASFDSALTALQGVGVHWLTITGERGSVQWRDLALEHYRDRFRSEPN